MSIGSSGRWGFIFFTSQKDNPTQWNRPIKILSEVSTVDDPKVDNWQYSDNIPGRLELYAYSSIIDPNNLNNSVDTDFYVYYTKINHNEDFAKMYLMRRRIILAPRIDGAADSAYIRLLTYAKGNKTRTTIVNPINEDYVSPQPLGLLSQSDATSNAVLLYECYIPIWDDYILIPDGCKDANHVRKLGYIQKTKTEKATLPLTECFSQANTNHYYVTNETCNAGDTKSWTYGYIYPDTYSYELSDNTCPLRGLGDATCDNKIDLIDFVCWKSEYVDKKVTTGCKSTDFNRKNGSELLDFVLWSKSFSSGL